MKNRYTTLPVLKEQPKGKPARWDELLLSADLRFKEDKKTGDYVVIQAWGRLDAGIYFLGEARGRWGFTDSVREFLKMSAGTPIGGFKPWLKLVENKANGPALENVLKAKVTGIVLEEPEGSKRARVEAITPLWEAGNVFLPDRSIYPEIDAIIEEWVSFGPGCAFDDRTDAMSQALKRLGSSITVDTTLENFVRW
jgi:predicted phage terminase large subunit-like protein